MYRLFHELGQALPYRMTQNHQCSFRGKPDLDECFRLDSSASVTLDFWPIAAAASCSRFASNCLVNRSLLRPKLEKKPILLPVRSGLVLYVAVQSFSSNGSALSSFDYGPRPQPPCNPYDPIFLITTSPRIPAPTPYLRPLRLPGGQRPRKTLPPTPDCADSEQSILFPSGHSHPRSYSKSIARRFQTASFKMLYRKPPALRTSSWPKLSSPERSRYSTKS